MKYNLIKNNDGIDNATLITPWSFIHLFSGFVGILSINYFNINDYVGIILLIIIHTLYEAKDFYFSYLYKGPKTSISEWSSKNSIFNSLGDTLFFIIGIYLGRFVVPNTIELVIIFSMYVIISYVFVMNVNLK